ncbi:VWA-like domain-containing protein [Nonomuraea sp. NPDC049709]|uniref:vWA domain-containing protein n=1 Tax=Nonomuraea sp. NPDC049709 TaxID=3154736 RepID=UPI003423B0A5
MNRPEKWAAARVWAAHQAPYLANALLALEPVMVPGSSALRRFPADPGWHVYVEPEELARQSVPEVGFWLIHQVTHLLREHARRYPGGAVEVGAREQRDWNLAADAEINDDVFGGVPLPAEAVTPVRLGLRDGGTAEQYWQSLRESASDARLPNGSPQTPEPPTQQPATHRPPDPHHPDPHRPDPRLPDPHHPEPDLLDVRFVDGDGGGDCGSGCDGLPRVWDSGLPGLSATSARLTALDTARRIRERLNAHDDIPAGWRRWADDVLEPTVNWRRHLSARVRHGLAQAAGRVDYTYSRPSRRAAALPGVILPSLRRPLPAVTVLIDTSGSITDTMLGQALAEVAGVLRAIGAGRGQFTVISCDAQAYRPQTLGRVSDLYPSRAQGADGTPAPRPGGTGALDTTPTPPPDGTGDPPDTTPGPPPGRTEDPGTTPRLRLSGGGGTDLRAGFVAALARQPPPDVIIAITDGRTPWPDRPPARTRVIVGLLDAAGHAPSWAETVLIDSGAS